MVPESFFLENPIKSWTSISNSFVCSENFCKGAGKLPWWSSPESLQLIARALKMEHFAVVDGFLPEDVCEANGCSLLIEMIMHWGSLKHFTTVLTYRFYSTVSIDARKTHWWETTLNRGNKNHQSFRRWSKVLVGPSQRWYVVPQVLLLRHKVQIWPRCHRGSRQSESCEMSNLRDVCIFLIVRFIWSEYDRCFIDPHETESLTRYQDSADLRLCPYRCWTNPAESW